MYDQISDSDSVEPEQGVNNFTSFKNNIQTLQFIDYSRQISTCTNVH